MRMQDPSPNSPATGNFGEMSMPNAPQCPMISTIPPITTAHEPTSPPIHRTLDPVGNQPHRCHHQQYPYPYRCRSWSRCSFTLDPTYGGVTVIAFLSVVQSFTGVPCLVMSLSLSCLGGLERGRFGGRSWSSFWFPSRSCSNQMYPGSIEPPS